MTTESKVPTPKGLADRGRKFWQSTVSAFEMTPAEQELLLEVCRTVDTLDRLEASIAADGDVVTGSKGQPVVNGALTEIRGQRLTLHRLIAALGLPDEDGSAVPSSTTMRARTAASARWSGQRTEASKKRFADGEAS